MPRRTPRRKTEGNTAFVAAAVLLVLISLLAVGGILLLVIQERSRLHISAEFRAFQVAADLLQAFDRGDTDSIARVEGLSAFGVYNTSGEALFRYGEAPATLSAEEAEAPARFSGGSVTFARVLGGPTLMMRGRGLMFGRGGGDADAPPLPPPMPRMMERRQGRMIFVSYEFASLRRGERVIITGGSLVVAALALAFAILLFLARKLDAYRSREAHDRELVALGEAARTLAHEIKNPLGVVKIQCALLKKGGEDGGLKNIRVIEEETDRLALLADHVRLFLAGGEGKPEIVRVASYLPAYAERYGGAVRVVGAVAEDMAVSMDRGRLDQILDNLVSNARESMDGSPAPVELSALPMKGSHVAIKVADRGRGIPEAEADRVFDLFYTTKTTGSGLGLATARRFAEAAGGKLAHEAREGGGTVFTLALPSTRVKRGGE